MSLPILFGLYIFTDLLTLIFGIATAFATYFITQDIYAVYNNAVLHSYINAIVNMVGLSIALAVRYVIVLFEMEYAYLSIPIVLVTLIPYLLKRYWFNRSLKTPILNQQKYRKYYFLAGGSLVISTLAVSFYTQITSLMLAKLTSLKDLGIYAVAVTLGTAWSFINFAVITSVLSKIYREKDHYQSYVMVAKLNLVILAVSLSVVAVLGLLGPWIIETLYGAAYQDAYKLLIILALSTMLSGLGTIAARLMVKEESYAYISKKMLFVALSALPISYGMIYVYGLIGAAYSVFIIELLSLTIFNYFYKDGLIFKIHLFPFFKHSLKFKH